MTAYVTTRTVAHVMQMGQPGVWYSKCRKIERLFVRQGVEPVVQFTTSNGYPAQPWCVFCARRLHNEALDVLVGVSPKLEIHNG